MFANFITIVKKCYPESRVNLIRGVGRRSPPSREGGPFIPKLTFSGRPDAHFIGPPGLSYKISNNLFIAYLVQRKNRVLLIPKSRIETWGE